MKYKSKHTRRNVGRTHAKSKTQRNRSMGGQQTTTTDLCPLHDVERYYDRKVNPSGKYYNQYHKMCVFEFIIYYVTPKYYIEPNLESIITSKFSMLLGNSPEIVSRKVKIENKYVSSFVQIDNDWYAVMRVLWTSDSLVFSHVKHRVFFKLSPNVLRRKNNGLLEFSKSESYELLSGDTIKIKDNYVENIAAEEGSVNCTFSICKYTNLEKEKNKIFMILDTFRFSHINPRSII